MKNWIWFLVEGILFVIIGVLAFAVPAVSTIAFTVFIGWLYMIGGIFRLIRTISAWKQYKSWLMVITALLMTIAGGILVFDPFTGAVTLTLILSAFIFVEGILQIINGIQTREFNSNWGWIIFHGALGLILATLIFSEWPLSSFWFLGILVGINMFFAGSSLIAFSLAVRKAESERLAQAGNNIQ